MENNIIKKNIDFNCTLGLEQSGLDNESALQLIEYVSTINIACGFHAGSPISIKKVLEYSRYKNKVIGASIGFSQGIDGSALDADEIEAFVIYQVGALASYAKSYGLNIEHVRPSGEMYKLAAQNADFSIALAKGIKKFSQWMNYYGPAGENLEKAALETNVNIAREIILDKNYNADGSINFDMPDIEDKEQLILRAEKLIREGKLEEKDTAFDTIHFNVKTQNILEAAQKSCELIQPTPVNYNKALASGWV